MADPAKILVPLDGSPLAEHALGEALTIGRALGATVILLQVIEPAPDVVRSGTIRIAVDEVFASQRADALRYLDAVRHRPEWSNVPTEIFVELGRPAETILDFARVQHADRIVMATHGRTGLTRWVLGSVAEKVLHAADRTVVLVRAPLAA